jgi:hypothetical protein
MIETFDFISSTICIIIISLLTRTCILSLTLLVDTVGIGTARIRHAVIELTVLSISRKCIVTLAAEASDGVAASSVHVALAWVTLVYIGTVLPVSCIADVTGAVSRTVRVDAGCIHVAIERTGALVQIITVRSIPSVACVASAHIRPNIV